MTDRINSLIQLSQRLAASPKVQELIATAERKNPWFVPAFVKESISAISNEMLNEKKLHHWLSEYERREVAKTIGIIMAGNVPLVGFHDFLCAYVLGCNIRIKLSSKDDELLPAVISELAEIDTGLNSRIAIVDKLKDFDAVIATGSDNTNRHFEYYFRNYPKILRRNRNSVAVLNGKETDKELSTLADDIFMYFGFGCRNVSKVYLPAGYDHRELFPHFSRYAWLHQHNKFMSNYDYQRTILMLNKTPHHANEFVMMVEHPAIPSPIATLHYEFYNNAAQLAASLKPQIEKIQCIVSSTPEKWQAPSSVSFGQSQHPELWDYADGVDTVKFLLSLG